MTIGRQSKIKQRLERRSSRHAGRSYGALIPLLGGITPEFIYSIAKSFIYTLHMLVEFHLPTSLFSFLHNYSFSFIYLQNIIPTDYIPTSFTTFATTTQWFLLLISSLVSTTINGRRTWRCSFTPKDSTESQCTQR